MTRYGIIGWGRIGARVAARLGEAAHLVAVLVRPGQDVVLPGAAVCTTLGEFVAARPEVAVESASASALAAYGPALLAAGVDLIPLSLAALADRATERRLLDAAARGPGRIEIAPGAMGSLDALAAAREDGLARVMFRATHPPRAWRQTFAATLIDLDAVAAPTLLLRGSVREVAARFPRNLNLSVGVALAGLGLDRTEAELYVDPAIGAARFELEIEAGPGAVRLSVQGRPRPAGADPVDYTTFSVMRLLRRRTARIAI